VHDERHRSPDLRGRGAVGLGTANTFAAGIRTRALVTPSRADVDVWIDEGDHDELARVVRPQGNIKDVARSDDRLQLVRGGATV
jgi:hypothetical protein